MPCLNDLKKGYRPYPLCDSHVHIAFPMEIGDTERFIDRYMTYFGLERVALLALPHSSRASSDDPCNNLKALCLKRRLNALWPEKRVYAFGGLYHHFDRQDTPEGFVSQAAALKAAGFDGLKVLLGKPALRRRLGVGLDDPLLEGVWRFCERERFPVTLHLGDPASFWLKGADGAPPVYNGDFPTLEQLRAETERVLSRHPGLDITLCHFYFMAEEPLFADRLMEEHPSVSLDLTPGSEMYYGFTLRHDFWRDFFLRHQTRILFGTDSDNWDSPAALEKCERSFSYPFNLVRSALEGAAPFRFEDHDYGPLEPLALPGEALMNIYHDNLARRLGEPKPVDGDALRLRMKELLGAYKDGLIRDGGEARRALEQANLETMLSTL